MTATYLPPYDETRGYCAKCGNTTADVEWHPAGATYGGEQVRAPNGPDRIKRTCHRCGYAWDERPLDAPAPTLDVRRDHAEIRTATGVTVLVEMLATMDVAQGEEPGPPEARVGACGPTGTTAQRTVPVTDPGALADAIDDVVLAVTPQYGRAPARS